MIPPEEFADLLATWQTLIQKHSAATETAEIGQALLTSWGEPHRRYHNTAHLREVLLRVDELAAHADDPDAVRLAAWYHDVVYRGRPDDEENSARRAESDLDALGLAPVLVREVSRLVRLTASHAPAPGDRNGEVLSDADLAILAAPPDRYAAYTAAVRAEYAHVLDETFRAGRANVLRALLNGPAIYRTPYAHAQWETRARVNLSNERDGLTSSA
ncbi:metal-dependent phosphohydrolase [Mycobacterium sp. pW045]|uniref:HD domain-containing protein n=1 Tax=Mycobacterium sp. pW045 TaxID=3238984 RepID=UPI00351B9220